MITAKKLLKLLEYLVPNYDFSKIDLPDTSYISATYGLKSLPISEEDYEKILKFLKSQNERNNLTGKLWLEASGMDINRFGEPSLFLDIYTSGKFLDSISINPVRREDLASKLGSLVKSLQIGLDSPNSFVPAGRNVKGTRVDDTQAFLLGTAEVLLSPNKILAEISTAAKSLRRILNNLETSAKISNDNIRYDKKFGSTRWN